MSTSVIGFPVGPWMGFASTSIEEVLTAGYEAPDLAGVGAAFPIVSILIAGERGALEFSSAETEGVLPGCPLIVLTRDDGLDWRSM